MTLSKQVNLPTLVMKFGGTSVGSQAAFTQVAEIVRAGRKRWPRLVVVASAMAGVTDLLLEGARRAVEGETKFVHRAARDLRQKHFAIAEELVLEVNRQDEVKEQIFQLVNDFTNLCQAITVLGEATPRALAVVAALGERLCVRLLSAILETRGIPAPFVEATELIVTDGRYQDARPDYALTTGKVQQGLGPWLEKRAIPVVTGFIAATPEGITTTLGRGGSDYTAAILGAVLPADEVWIWTDVDGVMSADPRLVAGARTIPELSYREIAELAYYGAKVVHPRTIRPVIEKGIPLRVANTFNPGHPGTRLLADRELSGNGAIKAVTSIRQQSLITIEGRGMLGVPGVAARTFGAVAATGISVPMITQASSEQSICFVVPLGAAGQVVAALEDAFAAELARRDIDRIWATDEVVIRRVFTSLGARGVNVIAIAQGSSEVSISLVVSAPDATPGLHAIHDLIVK